MNRLWQPRLNEPDLTTCPREHSPHRSASLKVLAHAITPSRLPTLEVSSAPNGLPRALPCDYPKAEACEFLSAVESFQGSRRRDVTKQGNANATSDELC